MSAYAWIITRDHIEGDTESTALDTIGPCDASPSRIARLREGEGVPFRMYDDDGERYYDGRIVGDAKALTLFEPLDDFGTGNAGCTRIDYRDNHGIWKAL